MTAPFLNRIVWRIRISGRVPLRLFFAENHGKLPVLWETVKFVPVLHLFLIRCFSVRLAMCGDALFVMHQRNKNISFFIV